MYKNAYPSSKALKTSVQRRGSAFSVGEYKGKISQSERPCCIAACLKVHEYTNDARGIKSIAMRLPLHLTAQIRSGE
jgi:hypothetical protein